MIIKFYHIQIQGAIRCEQGQKRHKNLNTIAYVVTKEYKE